MGFTPSGLIGILQILSCLFALSLYEVLRNIPKECIHIYSDAMDVNVQVILSM